jgi:hypothetical protein
MLCVRALTKVAEKRNCSRLDFFGYTFFWAMPRVFHHWNSMETGSSKLFESLSDYQAVENLITIAEAEGLFLECKSPGEPRLSKEQRFMLAKGVSGFRNTEGGCIIWGVSTTKHAHSGLDVISQIEPIGQVRQFAKQLDATIPRLTTPSATDCASRVLIKRSGDSKGIVVTHVPKAATDPTQSVQDHVFYFRSGDEFIPAPYEIIRRHFAGSQSPDLAPIFRTNLVKLEKDGSRNIPIILENRSSAIAEYVKVCVEIINPSACERIDVVDLTDQSSMNPTKRLFMADLPRVIHRGVSQLVGSLRIRMAEGKRAKRKRAKLKLEITISVYANRMRAQRLFASLILAKKGFTAKGVRVENVY